MFGYAFRSSARSLDIEVEALAKSYMDDYGLPMYVALEKASKEVQRRRRDRSAKRDCADIFPPSVDDV